jgi:cysteine desulfurase
MSSSSSLLTVPESTSSQRCYLVNSTESRSLIEHYSEDDVEKFLAYWTCPADKKIPKFKFTQNWGKAEIVNFAKGDTFGRNAYFSGVCQWLKKAKTFDATIAFCDQYPGWECDLYFYLSEPVDGVQMVRVEFGEVFSVSLAIGVAILPRGTDFLHQDFRTQIGVQQWLSEGSKIGYTSKLDVKAGSAFPKSSTFSKPLGASVSNPPSIKDEARPKPRLSVTASAVSNIPRSVNNEIKKCVYLDYNGTTPIYPPILEAMLPYLTEHFGNPSSSHKYGQEPKRAVDKARRSLLRVIQHSPGDDADASCILFTGCGTESNNLAIRLSLLSSLHRADENGLIHVISTNVEHPAITQCLSSYSAQDGGLTPKISVTYVPVDEEGIVSIDDVINAIRPNTVLITVMTANNEVGSIQPVFDIAKLCRERRVLFHTDAAQAVGKIDLRELGHPLTGADMVTFVGHKFGAPKGIAALYIRPGALTESGRRDPENGGSVMLLGGGQEGGRRGGTENVPYIVGMGRAAELLLERKFGLDGWQSNAQHMEAMRQRLLRNITKGLGVESTIVRTNGPDDPKKRLPNTLSIGMKGIRSGELLARIGDLVACSAGSACHSSSSDITSYSSILKAMNIPPDYAAGTLRLSVGPDTTEEEVDFAAEVIVKETKKQLGL